MVSCQLPPHVNCLWSHFGQVKKFPNDPQIARHSDFVPKFSKMIKLGKHEIFRTCYVIFMISNFDGTATSDDC